MESKNEIAITNENDLKDMIYEIRGHKVMLDFDLAKIYGYETKNFNRQVKNNIERFPSDFMFQLRKEEIEQCSRCNFFTLNDTGSGRGYNIKYLPYAFTEQGIYMLMTVLKGELAARQSITLIRIFKEMKDFIAEKGVLIGSDDIAKLALQTSENTTAIAKINEEMLRKTDLPNIFKNFSSQVTGREFLLMNGQLAEADVVYQSIYAKAKNSIFIIDDYISIKTLLHLRNIGSSICTIIFSDNKQNYLNASDFNDYEKEYPHIHIIFKKSCGIVHDRYIIIDYEKRSEKIYHCGTSSKDAGKRITTIIEVKDKSLYRPVIEELMSNPELELK